MLSSEFCPQSEKTLAVVETLEQDKFDTGAQVVPSHPQMNGHVHTNSQNGFSKDEVEAPTMEERPSLLCADPLLAVETGCPVGIREVENQGGFSHEDIELNVDEAAGRDGSAMEKEYKNSPLASPTVCRPKPSKKLGWYLAKQKDQEHGSWPHVDVSPRCMQPHSECGINRIKINCDQVPPLASSSGDLDDLTSFDEFAHMEASSSLNFLISSSSSSDSDRIFLDEKAASASSSRSSSISTSSSSSSSSSSDCDFTFSDIEVDAEEKKAEVYRESEWQTPFQIFLSPRLESIREGTKEDSAGEVSEEEEENVKAETTSFFSTAESSGGPERLPSFNLGQLLFLTPRAHAMLDVACEVAVPERGDTTEELEDEAPLSFRACPGEESSETQSAEPNATQRSSDAEKSHSFPIGVHEVGFNAKDTLVHADLPGCTPNLGSPTQAQSGQPPMDFHLVAQQLVSQTVVSTVLRKATLAFRRSLLWQSRSW